jgi:aminoglycoside 2''-phosphotransferase
MENRKDSYVQRVRALRPKMEIRSIEANTNGLLNDVLIVNRDLVFRFAKTDASKPALRREARLLQLLDGRLSLSIPKPLHIEEDLMVYPFIEGSDLTRTVFMRSQEEDRRRLARQIGTFLNELHSVPLGEDIPDTTAPVTRGAWEAIREDLRERLYPLMLPHQVDWANHLLDEALASASFFEYDPVLIHGDLAPYHILYRPSPHRIWGFIDFGVAGRGDPANDLALLIQAYGESTLPLMLEHYPQGKAHLKRARFYAEAIELQWALNGIKTREAFWFLAHLGGARDINE